MCNTCHKRLSRNEMPCQAVFHKMSLEPIPDELNDLKELEKILTSKKTIFKKITIMNRKGGFAKIYYILFVATNICNILLRPADSNGVIVVKLKRDLQFRD